MATDKEGAPPTALEPKVVKKLLDLLSTDDDFRSLFEKDAHAALVEAGYTPPEDSSSLIGREAAAQSGGNCLQLKITDSLASKDQISQERAKLESDLLAVFHFDCPNNFKAD